MKFRVEAARPDGRADDGLTITADDEDAAVAILHAHIPGIPDDWDITVKVVG